MQFLVRDGHTGQEILVYDGIGIYAPPVYAGDIVDLCNVVSDMVVHECTCDMGALCADLEELSGKVDEISAELSDRWKCGGTYDDNCYG